MSDLTYTADAESPSVQLTWNDASGTIINFSSGYTFTVKLVKNGVTALTKTTGITGAATSPNLTINWSAGELNISAGIYTMFVYARDASNKDRVFRPDNLPTLRIIPAPS